jgi:hypothetical protein
MAKHVTELTLAELAEAGAAAAQQAAGRAYAAGLSVVGTIEVVENGRVVEQLVECSPSGELTVLKTLGFVDCVDT